MKTKTGTLTMSIGEDFGTILTNIAQEHFLYSYDFDKAIRTITESLSGISIEMALDIIVGKKVMTVDNQQIVVKNRVRGIKYETQEIDINKWVSKQWNDLSDRAGNLDKWIKSQYGSITGMTRKNYDGLSINFDWASIISFIKDEDITGLIEEIRYDEKVLELTDMIRIIQQFFKTSKQLEKVFYKIKRHFKNIDHVGLPRNCVKLTITFQSFISAEKFLNIYDEREDVDKFIKASIDIDKILKKRIKPVDILDNYNAGWLAPDGTYYGLNGEIANMLHNQIATALYDESIVPENEKTALVPEQWLEQNGWVKQHNNWILFSGYDNSRFGGKDIPITKKQINIIVKFGQTCHQGKLKIGMAKQHISAAMFGMIEPLQFKMKWFKF